MVKWMRVLLVEDGKEPVVCELPNNLKALELTVHGYIEMTETYRPGCVIIYNGINKLADKPVTRAEIKGTFIIARVEATELVSLSAEDIESLFEDYR